MDGFMNILIKENPLPHHDYLERLFSHKSHVDRVFKDVLGLYDIHHIAVTHITEKQELLTFSSTPALEFNLFNSPLWQFDKTYHPNWYHQCTHADWQSLYMPEQFDALYYLKQIKPQYSNGLSLATNSDDRFAIYSFASQKHTENARFIFNDQIEHLYTIGAYCSRALGPFFLAE